jgi:hypothetical protein
MAVVSPVANRPDYGPITNAAGEKPVRIISDGHGGTMTTTLTEAEQAAADAEARLAHDQRIQENLARWSPALATGVQAVAERRAEEMRKAGPPKREVLAQAHSQYLEAATEAERLTGAVAKARNFGDAAESRKLGIERALKDADSEATGRLIETFTGIAAEPAVTQPAPSSNRTAALRSSLSQAEREGELAAGALAKLEGELAQAQQKVNGRAYDLHSAGLALLTDHGVDLAAEIFAIEEALESRRAVVDHLARFVQQRGQRLFRSPPALPSSLERFRFASKQPSAIDWESAFAAVISDPHAPLPGAPEPVLLVEEAPEPVLDPPQPTPAPKVPEEA